MLFIKMIIWHIKCTFVIKEEVSTHQVRDILMSVAHGIVYIVMKTLIISESLLVSTVNATEAHQK